MSKIFKRCVYFSAIAVFSLMLLLHNIGNTMAAYEEGDVSNGGTITGSVKFAGDVSDTKMLEVTKDQKTCGADPKPSEALLISPDKNIKSAVVSITTISKGKKFDRSGGNPTVDQQGCVFIPHLTLVPAGGTIDLLNSDDVMHNLHSYSMKNTAFNEGVAGGGKLPKKFEYPETVKLKCDVHKWMDAWIIVQDNPYYAVTDENGSFSIGDVPPGTYTVLVWQEKLGKDTKEITVKAGEEVKVDFEMKAKKKRARRKKK